MNNNRMIVLLKIIRIACIVFFVIFLFFWLMANGSGHEIPQKTHIKVAVIEFSLIILFFVSNAFLSKK